SIVVVHHLSLFTALLRFRFLPTSFWLFFSHFITRSPPIYPPHLSLRVPIVIMLYRLRPAGALFLKHSNLLRLTVPRASYTSRIYPAYRERIRDGHLKEDAHQVAIIKKLEILDHQLLRFAPRRVANPFVSFLGKLLGFEVSRGWNLSI